MSETNERSVASTGSVRPFAWAVCNPVGTYYRSFGYHREALECCLQKTRETGDCFYVRALYAAPPQDGVVRLPPLDPNGAPGWNAAIGAVREALADAGVDWDTERDESDRPEPIAGCDCPVQENAPKPDTTPTQGSLPPEWTSKLYWVDPPEGWRYGFPRLYDAASDGDMTAWMVANGYPQRMADQGLPCTFTACTEDGEM